MQPLSLTDLFRCLLLVRCNCFHFFFLFALHFQLSFDIRSHLGWSIPPWNIPFLILNRVYAFRDDRDLSLQLLLNIIEKAIGLHAFCFQFLVSRYLFLIRSSFPWWWMQRMKNIYNFSPVYSPFYLSDWCASGHWSVDYVRMTSHLMNWRKKIYID